MLSSHRLLITAAASIAAAWAGLPAHAQSVRTVTDIWGGSNNGAPGCAATFGPAPELAAFFNGGGFRAVGGNVACGYSGSTSDQSAAAGPLVTTRALSAVGLGNAANPYGSFAGTVSSRASYGSLGVEAVGRLAGAAANTDATSAAAAAFFDDRVTASSPLVANLSGGFVRYVFAIDGNLVTQPAQEAYHPGFAALLLDYQHAGGPIYQDAFLSTSPGSSGTYSAIDGDPSTWSFAAGTISGSGLFYSLFHPIEFGVPWELRVGMLAQTVGEGAADFFSTGRIADVELYDASMRRLADVTLSGVSGTTYVGAVAPVPEPETWAFMAAGLAALGWLGRRRGAVPRAAST